MVRSKCLGAVLLAGALAGCGGTRDSAPPSSPSPSPAAADPAARPVGTPSGRYVGSAACRPCHASAFRAWEGSRHHLTLRPVSASAVPRIAGTGPHEGFVLDASGRAEGPGPDGKPAHAVAAYVVGGRHREDVFVRMEDGRLQVFPVAYDADAGAPFVPLQARAGGALPPPDSLDFWTAIGRSADLTCYGCHATGSIVTASGMTAAGNAVPHAGWSEAGVGCESCHGPGGRHVDAARDGRPLNGSIRNGRASDAEAAVDACASCHGVRDLLGSPFRATPAHQDGAPLWAFADPVFRSPSDFEFREAFWPDLRPSAYQLEALALGQTSCVRRGALTCSKCHDPHSGAPEAALTGPRGGDDACLPCHDAIAARVGEHSRHPAGSAGARCLACHMAPILRGPGKDWARDHSLAPPAATARMIPDACAVCHPGTEWRDRLRSAWTAFPHSGNASRRRAALAAALDPKAGGKGAASRLASIVRDRDNGWLARWAALARVGPGLERSAGELAAALRAALADPNPAVRRAAARALGRVGTRADGEALVKLLEDPDAFVALEAAMALGVSGDPAYRTRVARVLDRPEMAGEFRAQLAVGGAALAARDWAVAAPSLSRALELDPTLVTPWNDLGVALYGLGRADEARAAWNRALELNPSFQPARRNLEGTRPAPAASPR